MSEQYLAIDNATLYNLKYYMPEQTTLRQLANAFSAFSDKTRLEILSALALSPMCVGELSRYLKLNQTTLSHQLRLLKDIGAVTYKRYGKIIVYKLKDEIIPEILSRGVDFILK